MSEGRFRHGLPNGFNRFLNAYNGFCRMGYYKDGNPYGKWCHFDETGKFWKEQGIWNGTDLIK
jgi:hypothetical protein